MGNRAPPSCCCQVRGLCRGEGRVMPGGRSREVLLTLGQGAPEVQVTGRLVGEGLGEQAAGIP